MDNRQIQTILNTSGFPCGAIDGVVGPQTAAAVVRFQQAYNGPDGWLEVDGVPGPKTQSALADLPYLSPHFPVREVACHHCGLAYVRRELLNDLETLRGALQAPVPLADAYRCAYHNRAVGGAKDSMHLYGYGADPAIDAHVDQVYRMKLFSGIGDKNGVVKHVDLRHLSTFNETPDATPAAPARWQY